MNQRLLEIAVATTVLLAPVGMAYAVESPWNFSAGGLLFGDLYHVPNHHLPEGDGATGAVIRRGYLTFNAKYGEGWHGRMRFEANQSGEFTCE